MPKRKADKVIEYRISLQDKEREMIDSALGAYQMNRIATPIVNLMNDVSGMTVLLVLLASILGFTFSTAMLASNASVADVIDAFLTQREQAIASGVIGAAGVYGQIPGPFGHQISQLLIEILGLTLKNHESESKYPLLEATFSQQLHALGLWPHSRQT